MTQNPPTQPDQASSASDASELSIQEQIDKLLMEIETEEPGTIDQDHLPASFKAEQTQPPTPTPAPATEAQDAAPGESATAGDPNQDVVAQAMQAFEHALDGDGNTDAPAAGEAAAPEPAATEPEAAPEPAAAGEHDDLLASLNAALQDMNPKPAADAAPAAAAPETTAQAEPASAVAADAPADAPAEKSTESVLQDEINDLLNAPIAPEAEPEPEPEAEVAAEAAAAPDLEAEAKPEPEPVEAAPASTQDQLANEIQNLLNSDAATDAQATDATDESPDASGIEDLDKMLADEIDADDELAGDFHSVDDVTAGIDTGPDSAGDDEHAATARDVAAELDNQPEDHLAPEPDIDPFAAIAEIASTAEKNEKAYVQDIARNKPSWRQRLEVAKQHLLKACFVINWPARRFLTTEWRANLGYIALLQLFFVVAIWLYVFIA